jgi:hypothetical protein
MWEFAPALDVLQMKHEQILTKSESLSIRIWALVEPPVVLSQKDICPSFRAEVQFVLDNYPEATRLV